MKRFIFSLVTLLTVSTFVVAEDQVGESLMAEHQMTGNQVATLRGNTVLNQEGMPPRIAKIDNKDIKREREYPQQPPTIPHTIDGYQIDLNYNKCVSCHGRKNSEKAQAPMVSITHFQNREGQFLIDVTPARYFCTQCHVPQQDVKPLVGNTFVDMDTVVKQGKETAKERH